MALVTVSVVTKNPKGDFTIALTTTSYPANDLNDTIISYSEMYTYNYVSTSLYNISPA